MDNQREQNNPNVNKKIWIGTAVFIIVTAVICACMVLITPGELGFFTVSFGEGEAMLQNTAELTVEENTSLEISVYSDNIYFYESDNDQLVIKEYYRTGRHPLAEISQIGNQVRIAGRKFNEWILFGWFTNRGDRIEVYLPRNQKDSIPVIAASVSSGSIRSDRSFEGKRITLESSSGSISWERSIQAEDIRLSASSGSVKVEDLTGEVTVKTTSGSIGIGRVMGNIEATGSSGGITMIEVEGDLRAKVNSGSIKVEEAAGFVTASTSSGSIKVLRLSGGAEVDSSSGSVTIGVGRLEGDIRAHTSSGSVKIQIPRGSEFLFQAGVNSGGIHTDFDEMLNFDKDKKNADGMIGEDPRYEIRANASSGSVRVTY